MTGETERLMAENEKLRKALEPFAAFARAAETVRRMSGGYVSETRTIQSVSCEGVIGVLVYGHLLDALDAFGDEAEGWGGIYRPLRPRPTLSHPTGGENDD